MSGGAYFRLYPYRLTRALVKRLERGGERMVFYAHPWEYDPEHPRIRLPSFVPHVTHYVNLGTMTTRGEVGVLILPLDSLVRMSSNPFFPYMLERIEEGIPSREKTPADPSAK